MQVVERMPGNWKAPSSNPSTTKKKKVGGFEVKGIWSPVPSAGQF
jgi:hypothetical protein